MTQHTITYDDATHQVVPKEPTEKMIVVGFESAPDECFSPADEWDRYSEMTGCQQAAYRARRCWDAMLAAAPQPEVVSRTVPSDDIDIEAVREYLEQWGCLAHPGVRALLERYSQPAVPAEIDQDAWIDAADEYVSKFDGQADAEDRAVIRNAYFAGGEWVRKLLGQSAARVNSNHIPAGVNPAKYTLEGLISEAKIASDPDQGAVPWYMCDLLRQALPFLESVQPAASAEPVAWLVSRTGGGVIHAANYTESHARRCGYSLPVYAAPVAGRPVVTEEMVSRFLGWKLPKDFYPDCGISFTESALNGWPSGTNLFHAGQVREMLEYVLAGTATKGDAHHE